MADDQDSGGDHTLVVLLTVKLQSHEMSEQKPGAMYVGSRRGVCASLAHAEAQYVDDGIITTMALT